MAFYKKNNASALLIVFGITSTIGFFTLGWWYRSATSYDVVCERERYYENFYMTDRELMHGVNIAKNYFSEFIATREPKRFIHKTNTDTSVADSSVTCIIAPAKEDRLYIVAMLYRKGELSCVLACSLVKKNKKFFIKNYTIA